MSDQEQKIRERAHALWEREGRPDGRQEEHWLQAQQELESEAAPGDGADDGAEASVRSDTGAAVPVKPAERQKRARAAPVATSTPRKPRAPR